LLGYHFVVHREHILADKTLLVVVISVMVCV